MSREFDAGYLDEPFASLVRDHPGAGVYPPKEFRVEWGPVFHRGRLDGTARVLVIGQDPGAHEAVVRRILVGEAGQRVQGLLRKMGITTSYVMVNAFLYSVYGQWGGWAHRDNPAIASYRNRWLDALLHERSVQAVISLGSLADRAFGAWKETPTGQSVKVAYRRVLHPTYPEGQREKPRAEATKELLADWNAAVEALRSAIRDPDLLPQEEGYSDRFDVARDLAPIPERDLPPGLPEWMRSLESWAERRAVYPGDPTEEKRRTLVLRVPAGSRPWDKT